MRGKEADEERDKAALPPEDQNHNSQLPRSVRDQLGVSQVSREARRMIRMTIQERVVLVVTLHRKVTRHKKRNKRKKLKRLGMKIFRMRSLIILEMKEGRKNH